MKLSELGLDDGWQSAKDEDSGPILLGVSDLARKPNSSEFLCERPAHVDNLLVRSFVTVNPDILNETRASAAARNCH